MNRCGCGQQLRRNTGGIGMLCDAGHVTWPFLPPPKWKPGRCPDAAHKAGLMAALDPSGGPHDGDPARALLWWCGEPGAEHYVRVDRPDGIRHVSPSSLATARQCMRRYWFQYVLRHKEPPGPEAVRGTLSHRILELLAAQPDGQRDLDRARKLANAEWATFKEDPDFLRLALTRDAAREFTGEAIAAVGRALELHPLNGRDILAAEHRFELHLNGVKVHGVMDLVERPSDPVLRDHGYQVFVTDYKGLALDTPLPTATGWTTMGDVAVGDMLLGADGNPTKVIGKSQVRHRPCYRIDFGDGSSVVCDDEHLWDVVTYHGSAPKTIDTDELHYRNTRGAQMHVLPPLPLLLPEADLPIEPYLFGTWLGDGDSRSGVITCGRQDVEALVAELERRGHRCRLRPEGRSVKVTVTRPAERLCRRGHERSARSDCTWCNNNRAAAKLLPEWNVPLGTQLRREGLLGMSGSKRIPPVFLRASVEQRMELLRGLMDSDGSWNPQRRQGIFWNTNKALADGVAELVALMGWRLSRWTDGYKHLVQFRPAGTRNPFSLPRKAEQVVFAGVGRSEKSINRTIRRVTPVASVPTQCVEVDAPDSLYLCGERMVPTHNSGKVPCSVGRLSKYDRKLDGTPAPAEDGEAEKLLQAHIYNAAARLVYEVPNQRQVGAQLLYIGQDVGVLHAVPSETRQAMDQVKTTWQQIKAAEEDGHWPASTGPLCGWCPHLVWDNGDGTFDMCGDGLAYAFRRIESRWGWTKYGTNEPVPAAVTIRGLAPEVERQARDAAAASVVTAPAPLRLIDGDVPF